MPGSGNDTRECQDPRWALKAVPRPKRDRLWLWDFIYSELCPQDLQLRESPRAAAADDNRVGGLK